MQKTLKKSVGLEMSQRSENASSVSSDEHNFESADLWSSDEDEDGSKNVNFISIEDEKYNLEEKDCVSFSQVGTRSSSPVSSILDQGSFQAGENLKSKQFEEENSIEIDINPVKEQELVDMVLIDMPVCQLELTKDYFSSSFLHKEQQTVAEVEIASTVLVSPCESTPPKIFKAENFCRPLLPTLEELCNMDSELPTLSHSYPHFLPFKLIKSIQKELDNEIVLGSIPHTSESEYSRPNNKDEESSESAESVYSEEEKADSTWEMVSEHDAENLSINQQANQESSNEFIDDSLDEGQANDPTAALLSSSSKYFEKSSVNERLVPEIISLLDCFVM